MRERWIWIVGLIFGITQVLIIGGPLVGTLIALAILAVAAVVAELITRRGIEKAARIRGEGSSP
jgi:hypothetical protein